VDVIADLEVLVEQAASERVLLERREQRLRDQLDRVRSGRSAASRARAGLVEKLEVADAALQAGRDRLGPARLAYAQAQREAERLADAAAGGSDPASRALARAADVEETTGATVGAHERRVAALAAEHEATQAALAAHDAGEVERVGGELEELLADVAREVDGHLERACEGALVVHELVDRRRVMKPREPWQPTWLVGSAHDHLRDAALAAFGRLEPSFARHGRTISRNSHGLSSVVANLVQCWSAARGGAAVPEDPKEAA
jgi:hypothetical protein